MCKQNLNRCGWVLIPHEKCLGNQLKIRLLRMLGFSGKGELAPFQGHWAEVGRNLGWSLAD
jgi:hypothetical protein